MADYHLNLHKAARPRALKIRALRKTKPPTTWKAIGEEFGITKQRAQQIFNQHFKVRK